MNTRRSALALGVAALVALAGCSSDSGSESPSPSASASAGFTEADVQAAESVEVTGDPGSQPTIAAAPDLTVSYTTPVVLDEGDGAQLEPGSLVTYTGVQTQLSDGTVLSSSWTDDSGTAQATTTILDANSFGSFTDIVSSLKVGGRLLLVAPTDSGVFVAGVFDFTATTPVPARASGTAVTPAEGLPTVTLADNGAPSITIPDGYTAPTELVVQPLIQGDGSTVVAGDNVVVNYTGWTLDGAQFDSSWDAGSPFTVTSLGSGSVITGWEQGLEGQTVGSQVLLVIPPDLAYAADSSSTLAGQTLVFVVDILAVY